MDTVKMASSHLRKAFWAREEIVESAKLTLANVEFDTLIGQGFSGALVVPLLGDALKKNFALVRKPGVPNHGEYSVEGAIGKRWIFVDDFIATGTTRRAVKDAVEKVSNLFDIETEYVGAYLYYHNTWYPTNDLYI